MDSKDSETLILPKRKYIKIIQALKLCLKHPHVHGSTRRTVYEVLKEVGELDD